MLAGRKSKPEPVEYTAQQVKSVFCAVLTQLAEQLCLKLLDLSKPEEPFFILQDEEHNTIATVCYGWAVRCPSAWTKTITYKINLGCGAFNNSVMLEDFSLLFSKDLRRYYHFRKTGSWFASGVDRSLILSKDVTFIDVSDKPIEVVDVDDAISRNNTTAVTVVSSIPDDDDNDDDNEVWHGRCY